MRRALQPEVGHVIASVLAVNPDAQIIVSGMAARAAPAAALSLLSIIKTEQTSGLHD